MRECGYRTYSLYSWFGGFVGARGFQTTAGIEHFLDSKQLGSGAADTDRFYYDHAARIIAEQRDSGPVFVFVYLAVNHFPWNYRYRPDLLPDWVNPGPASTRRARPKSVILGTSPPFSSGSGIRSRGKNSAALRLRVPTKSLPVSVNFDCAVATSTQLLGGSTTSIARRCSQ